MKDDNLKNSQANNHIIFYLPFLLLLTISSFLSAQTTLTAESAVRSSEDFEKISRVMVPELPFLYLNREEIAVARSRADKEDWAKKLKENYVRIAETWVSRDYDFVKRIIPVKGSIYTYGLGMDLDPIQQKKMKWRGWKDPRHVEAVNGAIYPNAKYQDEGSGWTDPKNKMEYFFIALANGMTIKQLESTDLHALVNAYLLTGNEIYAERALWILDAIATIYPRANEGPIDYPGLAPGKPDGGRLDRPYYQAARALMNYAYYAEMLSMSTHADKQSLSNPVYTMKKNIELNLLMNGADYCLRMTKAGKGASYELNNGNIDYNRAPLVVGAMLGITEWVDWALNGPLGFRYVITNTIDINGRYFETGTLYAQHTRDLLLSTALFLRRMRLPAYPKGFEAFDDVRFSQFALNFFTGIQVSGRLPLFGDAGPDSYLQTDGRIFDKGTLVAAQQFYRYTENKEIRIAAKQTAYQMFRNMPADYSYDEAELFRTQSLEEITKQDNIIPVPSMESRSTLLFDYGVLILRSGDKEKERAALMRFGPTLNHGQADELGLAFYAKGREFSFDPGYFNTHLRFGFTSTTVAHNILVVNRSNQLRRPAPGGDVQTLTDGIVLHSAAVNDPLAYASQNLSVYKRRVAIVDLSPDDSYIIDNFWASGGVEYDYSLHGISKGKLQILSASGTKLKNKRAGSVLSPDADYSSEMDPNGRINSYSDKPFYYAPPGAGYGFLSHPEYYSLKGTAFLKWSSIDKTGHEMYVWHFSPPSAELIIAQSPKPTIPIDVTYALSHVKVPASETVRFTSVILNTEGENKLAEVKQMLPLNGSKTGFALHLKSNHALSSAVRDHFYLASDKLTEVMNFEEGLSFSGEEGYLGLDLTGKVVSVSLTGTGYIRKDRFKFTATPLFKKPLEVLEVENQPLRILVNANYEQTKNLSGSIIRLNRSLLARPFVLRVNKSEAAGQNSWLTLDASSNIHAVGVVLSYDPVINSINTDAPFPHTRPYTYTYSEKTGFPSAVEKDVQYDYNGGYNGFWLVDNQNPKKRATIKNLENKRTQILLDGGSKNIFSPGDKFEIQLIAPGDLFEVPVWSQAKRNTDGTWQIIGPAATTITK
jgi:hypothetical protein